MDPSILHFNMLRMTDRLDLYEENYRIITRNYDECSYILSIIDMVIFISIPYIVKSLRGDQEGTTAHGKAWIFMVTRQPMECNP